MCCAVLHHTRALSSETPGTYGIVHVRPAPRLCRSSSHAMPCCAVLCCAVPCCAVLCCAVLCCAVLQEGLEQSIVEALMAYLYREARAPSCEMLQSRIQRFKGESYES
jgi:hypothetical protein